MTTLPNDGLLYNSIYSLSVKFNEMLCDDCDRLKKVSCKKLQFSLCTHKIEISLVTILSTLIAPRQQQQSYHHQPSADWLTFSIFASAKIESICHDKTAEKTEKKSSRNYLFSVVEIHAEQ